MKVVKNPCVAQTFVERDWKGEVKMPDEVKKVFENIRSLKIQGAENVASASVDALATSAFASKARDKKTFIKELRQTISFLKNARPTEPALRNALRFVLLQVMKSEARDPGELKLLVQQEARDYRKRSLETKLKIAEYGARLIPKNANVLIHCHSSTVMRVLKKAFDDRKNPTVYCLESRPLYQGRKSAAELSDYGLKTILTVDNANSRILHSLRDTDLVLVGADAITSEGDLVNKIGTGPLALAAKEHDKKLYACSGTHKFDPLTLWGEAEKVEERAAAEVLSKAEARKWKINQRKLKLLNPAFDLVEAKYVTAFVTELGVIPPQSLLSVVWREFELDKKGLY